MGRQNKVERGGCDECILDLVVSEANPTNHDGENNMRPVSDGHRSPTLLDKHIGLKTVSSK
jgi:hypothetical protein